MELIERRCCSGCKQAGGPPVEQRGQHGQQHDRPLASTISAEIVLLMPWSPVRLYDCIWSVSWFLTDEYMITSHQALGYSDGTFSDGQCSPLIYSSRKWSLVHSWWLTCSHSDLIVVNFHYWDNRGCCHMTRIKPPSSLAYSPVLVFWFILSNLRACVHVELFSWWESAGCALRRAEISLSPHLNWEVCKY